MMTFLIKTLCKIHNFIYFLIGQFAAKNNDGISPKHKIIKYHDFFVKNILPTDTVLDIGCGNGYVSFDVSQKAKTVIGIDFDKKNIDKANKKYQRNNLKFILGDATKTDFNKQFDVIILSNVLEHIEKRIEFLIKIRGLSNKILIRVPMINRDWLTLYKKEIGVDWRLDNTHFIEYTTESFKNEINKGGFILENYSIQFGEIWAIIKSNE